MPNSYQDQISQVTHFYMGFAIEKAYQDSPYIGVGCVCTSFADDKLVAHGSQRIDDTGHILTELLDKAADPVTVYLTQEPFQLNYRCKLRLEDFFKAGSVKALWVSNHAPGVEAGLWCRHVENFDVEVRKYDPENKLGVLPHVAERAVTGGRPWITCVLLLDEEGDETQYQAFHHQFGFSADLMIRADYHSVVLHNQFDRRLQDFYAAHRGRDNITKRQPVGFESYSSPLYTEKGRQELLDICRRTNAHAVFVPVTRHDFTELDKLDLVDELVVYSIGDTDDGKPLASRESGFRLLNGKWSLEDNSPLGESIRHIYRTFPQ